MAPRMRGDGGRRVPRNGPPKINRGYGIVKLKKRVEELERENEMLKNFRALLSQDRA